MRWYRNRSKTAITCILRWGRSRRYHYCTFRQRRHSSRENRLSDVPGTKANAKLGSRTRDEQPIHTDVCDEDHRDGTRTPEMGVGVRIVIRRWTLTVLLTLRQSRRLHACPDDTAAADCGGIGLGSAYSAVYGTVFLSLVRSLANSLVVGC